jgi:predicted ATP-binding protein involved in virulence
MRLQKIIVGGLFGRFNHEIPLKLTDRITIIISPNGFGKTMILRMVNAFLTHSYFALARIPFRELRLEFENNVSVSVYKLANKSLEEKRDEKASLKIAYMNGDKSSHTFTPKLTVRQEQLEFPIGAIEDIVPELDQVGPRLWRERGTGGSLSLEEVLEKYGNELPLNEEFRDSRTPTWLQEICRGTPVRFINTERLYTPVARRQNPHPFHRSASSSELAVRKYSQELGTTIKQTLSEYGTLSQSLDRTFPARLVAEPPQPDITLTDLLKKLEDIETKRARLVEAGLLTEEPDQYYWGGGPSLAQVDETRLSVLSVYARDAEKKLTSFDEVFGKIDLFKKIVNARFLNKKLEISQTGFGIITAEGSHLDPALLSSGEQHEIVLLYELLFRVHNNSIILIDEPELSLHVAWQEAFLPDLGEMAKLSKFDALIATHSPQIIGDRWDLTVELKGPPV